MHFFLQSNQLVLPDLVRAGAIEIVDGKILAIHGLLDAPPGAVLIDVGDNMVLPGLVDTHVHVNEPGRTAWEGFASATRAAASGGVTTIIDMPLNSIPSTINVQALAEKRSAARGQCMVDYGFWGGVVGGGDAAREQPANLSDIVPLADAGVLGFKCFLVPSGVEEFVHVTQRQLEAAMPLVAGTGRPLLVHAELPGPIEAAHANITGDPRRYRTYLASRPDESEVEAVRLMIRLSRWFRCRVHIVHLATAQALEDLSAARMDRVPVTVETCPHYLHLAAEEIPDTALQYKCAPPIRGYANRDRLWHALQSGLIDLIATDHSPSPPEMKQGDFFSGWGGIASLSLALPLVWSDSRARSIPITDVVRWLAEKPAELAGLQRKGRIEVGRDADLVVFDPEATFKVTAPALHYRHPISPYMNEKLTGVIETTYLRGVKVFDRGSFPSEPAGIELRT